MPSIVLLSALIEKGGVFYNIPGSNPVEALHESIKAIVLPKPLERESLLTAILEREALMPTAIGHGIAIPHPRNSLLSDAASMRVAVCFLKTPIAYNALDRKPVSTFFIILSSDARSHLAILASVSHLCQRPDFIELLNKRPSREELVSHIAEAEAAWAKAVAEG